MSNSEEDIIRYISGLMVPEEIVQFELDMQTDDELRALVADYKIMNGYSTSKNDLDQALQNLSEVHEEQINIEKTDPNSKSNRRIIWVLLLIFGLLGAVWIITKYQSKEQVQTAPELYTMYFNPDPASFQTKGTSEEELVRFQVFFNNESYEQAVESIDLATIDNTELRFYYALALIGSDELTQANGLLDEVSAEAPIFTNEVKYYKALSYLRGDQPEIARELLLDISTNSSKYQAARELLQMIEPSSK